MGYTWCWGLKEVISFGCGVACVSGMKVLAEQHEVNLQARSSHQEPCVSMLEPEFPVSKAKKWCQVFCQEL